MAVNQNIEFSIQEKHTLLHQYLNILFQNKKNYLNTSIAQTDGEILYPSINKILSHLNLTSEDIFVDLGSGTGKIIAQVFLNSSIKQAIGIEYVSEKHQVALAALAKLQNDLPDFFSNRHISFLLGDFLKIPFSSATVALITSTCFEQHTLDALGNLINKMSNLHTVLSLRPILTLKHLRFKRVIRIECSWDTALCYIYTKTLRGC